MAVKNTSALATALAVAAVAGSASAAISVTQSQLLQGYTGALVIKYQAYDEGRLYDPANGTYGEAAGVVGQAAQISALDAINGSSIAPTQPRPATEDSWGVFELTTIEGYTDPLHPNVLHTIWDQSTPVGGNLVAIRGILYGEQDTSLTQTGGTSKTQIIDGVDMSFAFWLIQGTASSVSPAFDAATVGPGARGVNAWDYPTVSDAANSALIWTAQSVVNPATGEEFQTTVTYDSISGVISSGGGQAAANWQGLSGIGTGAWNGGMDTSSTPNMTIGFSVDNAIPHGSWDTFANDPVHTNAVPEPACIALAGLAFVGLGLRRVRRAK